jgi:LysM repeat protein
VVRIVAPLAFIGVVVALVLVVMNSGILNGDEPIVSPSPTVSPSDPAAVGERTYKVKKNDTLSQIAERFGTSVDKILEANPKINLNNLRVGQKLKIPAQE